MQGYILVFTTSSAFESEMLLKAQNISVKLVPTPREYSSDCGIAVLFEIATQAELENIQKLLNAQKIEYEIKICA